MNFWYLLLLLVVNFTLLGVSYKLFGKKGVYGFIVLSVIAANIQVNKGVMFTFFGIDIEATLGNVMFGGVFLATDLLNEVFGKKTAQRAVMMSIYANVSFIIVMFVSTLFIGLSYSSDYNNALELFFGINGGALKAVIVGNVVYFISQSLDVLVYDKIRQKLSSYPLLFIRNNGSTLISQFVDTVLVSFGFALVGIFPFDIIGGIIISTVAIKYIVALLDTPFLYIMAKLKPLDNEK
ncbi:MAG: queuosine precursor transporter [Candidatus Izemoplasmatales bacterium]